MQVQAHPCRAPIKAPTEEMTGTRGFQQAGCRHRDAGRTCHHIQKTRGHSCPDRAGRPVRRRHPPNALQAPSSAPFRFRRGARCRSRRFTAAMDSITKRAAQTTRAIPHPPPRPPPPAPSAATSPGPIWLQTVSRWKAPRPERSAQFLLGSSLWPDETPATAARSRESTSQGCVVYKPLFCPQT